MKPKTIPILDSKGRLRDVSKEGAAA